MIVEWLVSVGLSIASWFCTLLPSWPVPAWLSTVGSSVGGLFAYAQGLGPFVDWPFVGTVIGVPLTLWGAGLLFKLGRLLVSHIPFFGGR